MHTSPQIERVPCLSDNYAWLLHEPSAGLTAVVSKQNNRCCLDMSRPVVGPMQIKASVSSAENLSILMLQVDPAEVAPVVAALRDKGWKLTHVLNSELL